MEPILNLHPDQVEGLSNDNYKNDLYHSCNVDLGFPAGETIVQVLKEKDTQFTPLDIWIEPDNTTLDEQCTNNKDVKFEIRFTSDMNNAVIRCGVKNQHFQNYITLYSNNETVSLISSEYIYLFILFRYVNRCLNGRKRSSGKRNVTNM